VSNEDVMIWNKGPGIVSIPDFA